MKIINQIMTLIQKNMPLNFFNTQNLTIARFNNKENEFMFDKLLINAVR